MNSRYPTHFSSDHIWQGSPIQSRNERRERKRINTYRLMVGSRLTSSTPFWRTCQIKKELGPYLYFVCFVFCLSHLLKDRENILPPTLGNLPLLYDSLFLAAALITLLARALILLDLRLGLRFGLGSTLISLGAVTHRFCSRVRTKAHQRPGTHNFISGIHSCGKLLRLEYRLWRTCAKTINFSCL
jgi:hypothetical protein